MVWPKKAKTEHMKSFSCHFSKCAAHASAGCTSIAPEGEEQGSESEEQESQSEEQEPEAPKAVVMGDDDHATQVGR